MCSRVILAVNVNNPTSIWKNYLSNLDLVPEEDDVTDYRDFLERYKPTLKEKIIEMMDESSVMLCCQLKVIFTKPETQEGETPDRYFNLSKLYLLNGSTMERERESSTVLSIKSKMASRSSRSEGLDGRFIGWIISRCI